MNWNKVEKDIKDAKQEINMQLAETIKKSFEFSTSEEHFKLDRQKEQRQRHEEEMAEDSKEKRTWCIIGKEHRITGLLEKKTGKDPSNWLLDQTNGNRCYKDYWTQEILKNGKENLGKDDRLQIQEKWRWKTKVNKGQKKGERKYLFRGWQFSEQIKTTFRTEMQRQTRTVQIEGMQKGFWKTDFF